MRYQVYAKLRSNDTSPNTVAHLSVDGVWTLCRRPCAGMLRLGSITDKRAQSELGWQVDDEDGKPLCQMCLRRARERQIRL